MQHFLVDYGYTARRRHNDKTVQRCDDARRVELLLERDGSGETQQAAATLQRRHSKTWQNGKTTQQKGVSSKTAHNKTARRNSKTAAQQDGTARQ
jgi:topoisomerase IA-like protein